MIAYTSEWPSVVTYNVNCKNSKRGHWVWMFHGYGRKNMSFWGCIYESRNKTDIEMGDNEWLQNATGCVLLIHDLRSMLWSELCQSVRFSIVSCSSMSLSRLWIWYYFIEKANRCLCVRVRVFSLSMKGILYDTSVQKNFMLKWLSGP